MRLLLLYSKVIGTTPILVLYTALAFVFVYVQHYCIDASFLQRIGRFFLRGMEVMLNAMKRWLKEYENHEK